MLTTVLTLTCIATPIAHVWPRLVLVRVNVEKHFLANTWRAGLANHSPLIHRVQWEADILGVIGYASNRDNGRKPVTDVHDTMSGSVGALNE